MKKIIGFTLSFLILFACISVSAQNYISVELDANKLEFDTQPINVEGRVLVPVRKIFESIGATVLWDEPTKTVTSTLGDITVVMTIDNPKMTVNSEEKTLDVSPKIVDGRTLVPARAATEAFGAKVSWDANTDTVKIHTQEFLSRTETMKTHRSSKTLTTQSNIKSDFSIAYFEDYDVRTDANDGTDFEIVASSDDYFALLSVRADVYVGPEHPMTDTYAESIASGMVKAVSGTLISTEISHIGEEKFIKIHYTNPGVVGNIPDDTADVLVYMGIKNGVVYTMTYTNYGEVPKNISSDINNMMSTLVIH